MLVLLVCIRSHLRFDDVFSDDFEPLRLSPFPNMLVLLLDRSIVLECRRIVVLGHHHVVLVPLERIVDIKRNSALLLSEPSNQTGPSGSYGDRGTYHRSNESCE